MTEKTSLTDMPVEHAIACATGNNARVYGLNNGVLAPGRDADVLILDSCVGGTRDNALDALRNGDIAAVGAAITAGVPRFVGRSRNTPAPMKRIRTASSRIIQDFSAPAH